MIELKLALSLFQTFKFVLIHLITLFQLLSLIIEFFLNFNNQFNRLTMNKLSKSITMFSSILVVF